MFRKIVSNLSFSPALVGQLGFYAKRLRKEEFTRKVGLIFVVLALVVQSLMVFQPSESANASSQNDFVPGGLGTGSQASINNFLSPYDANSNNLKDIMNSVGITRQEIASSSFTSWIIGEKYSWGHEPKFSSAQGEKEVNVLDSNGKKISTVYARPNKLFYKNNNSNIRVYGWQGRSAKLGWFAVMQACGNLMTDTVPTVTPTPTPTPTPKPTPTPTPANIEESKEAVNVSQGLVKASSVTAQAGDQIRYTLNIKNTGGTSTVTSLKDNLGDVLEYSTLIDKGGGTYNSTTKVLSWPDITLKAGAQQSRVFSVKLLDTIPATPTGTSDPSSFDCSMINVFGNDVTINVSCPVAKVVETTVQQLPKTGPTENILFAGIVLAVATYFYLRTRQVGKEVRLIRRDLNSGTI